MSKRQYAPEPWHTDAISGFPMDVHADYGWMVASCCDHKDGAENARRIVACVNACAGFSIEELEGASLFNDSISAQDEIDSLKSEVKEMKLIIATDTGTESAVAAMQKQRDELLAALEKAANTIWKLNDADIHAQEAEAVIASVKANT